MHALQKAGYFVAGMELFPSDDADSWAVIQRVIDQSDYYVLVVAGRYGSVARGNAGQSFTEMEYHYARDKGIPVSAFVFHDRKELKSGFVDENTEKLDAFIRLIEKNHQRNPWWNKDDLSTQVLASLAQQSNLRPGIGWVRGDVVSDYNRLRNDLLELQAKYEAVRTERDALEEQARTRHSKSDRNLAWGNDFVRLHLTIRLMRKNECIARDTANVELCWEDIFKMVAPDLIGWRSKRRIENTIRDGIKERLPEFVPSESDTTREVHVTDESLLLIRSQFVAFDLIEVDAATNTKVDEMR
ncbi:MAG TPA: DUF4062 domain-containing protein, partial [Planctomycetaceae bacterium]|nr:DUF4062 domain-containing protein [Planctomycetaceae bacterium]